MLLKIRVKTEAKEEKIVEKSEDTFLLHLKEPAENNLANDRVIEIFQSKFPGCSVKIVKGHHAPSKILEVGESR